MKIREKLYNLVVFNRDIKKIISFLLRSPFLLKNPVYNFFYSRLLKEKMGKFNNRPFRVMIENTNICNADCVFCPHRIMKRKTGVMEMSLFKKIIDECKSLGIEYITIYGFGEPLLDKYFIERVRYAKKHGLSRVTTNSNGMYLDKDKIDEIIKSGLDEIFISFDAATEKTYKKIRPGLDFEIVENNILKLVKEKKRLKSSKPEINLSYVEFEKNRHETDEYIKKWRGIVDHVSVSYIHNWTGEVENKSELKGGRKDPCRLLWTDMVVSWNGEVPLCCNDYENKIILGNVKKLPLGQIWGGERMREIRESHLVGKFNVITLCKNCEYNYHHKSPWWITK